MTRSAGFISGRSWFSFDINMVNRYVLCMRTTIHIDDSLYAELKVIAARTGRTLTAV